MTYLCRCLLASLFASAFTARAEEPARYREVLCAQALAATKPELKLTGREARQWVARRVHGDLRTDLLADLASPDVRVQVSLTRVPGLLARVQDINDAVDELNAEVARALAAGMDRRVPTSLAVVGTLVAAAAMTVGLYQGPEWWPNAALAVGGFGGVAGGVTHLVDQWRRRHPSTLGEDGHALLRGLRDDVRGGVPRDTWSRIRFQAQLPTNLVDEVFATGTLSVVELARAVETNRRWNQYVHPFYPVTLVDVHYVLANYGETSLTTIITMREPF